MTPFFRQFMDIAHRQYADAFVMNRHRYARWRVHPTDWQLMADEYSVPADTSGHYLYGLPVDLDDSAVEGPVLVAWEPPDPLNMERLPSGYRIDQIERMERMERTDG